MKKRIKRWTKQEEGVEPILRMKRIRMNRVRLWEGAYTTRGQIAWGKCENPYYIVDESGRCGSESPARNVRLLYLRVWDLLATSGVMKDGVFFFFFFVSLLV